MQSKQTMVVWFLVVSGLSFAWVTPTDSLTLNESVTFDASVSDEPNDDGDFWQIVWPEIQTPDQIVINVYHGSVSHALVSLSTIRGPPVV